MSVRKLQLDNKINLLITGDFDAGAVSQQRALFEETVNEAKSGVVIDMTAVNFIDSSGIGILVFMYKRLREKHLELIIVGLQGQPQKLVTMLRIDKTINCYDNLSAYLETYENLIRLGA